MRCPVATRRRFLALAGALAVTTFGPRAPANRTFGRLANPGESSGVVRAQSASPRLVVPGLAAGGPLPQIHLSAGSIYQGGVTRLEVSPALSGTAYLFERGYPLTPAAGAVSAYIPAGVIDPPGVTQIEASIIDPLLGDVTLSRPLTITATDWTVDYIWLPPGTGELLDPAIIQAEEDLLRAVYTAQTAAAYSEPWTLPLNPPITITGYFGEQRSFNGGPVSGHHGGTDFGALARTPVLAVNHGRVALARELAVRGNMVIIDHGGGILSGYAHLSQLGITEGSTVARGEVIGLVGSTGLSTGAHLHWEQVVSGIPVDGLRWTDGSQGF